MTKKAKAAPTIATALTGASDAPVVNQSTTKDITKESTPTRHIPGICSECGAADRHFVTRDKVTTLRCKICDSQVEPADEGEAQSLADYNKTA